MAHTIGTLDQISDRTLTRRVASRVMKTRGGEERGWDQAYTAPNTTGKVVVVVVLVGFSQSPLPQVDSDLFAIVGLPASTINGSA